MGLFKFLRSFKGSREENGCEGSMELEDPRVHDQLEEACLRHSFVAVFVEGNHTEFKSSLLKVKQSEEESYLLIDLLSPVEGNEYVKRSQSIRLEYVMEGTEYVFQSRFTEEMEGFQPGVKLAYPELISRKHLRRYLRVSPLMEEPVSFSFETPAGIKVAGNIADISGGGFGFSTNLVEVPIEPGTILPSVKLALPAGEIINAKAVLRNLTPRYSAEGARRYQYGVEFTGISESDLSQVIRYIFTLQ